MQIDWVVEESFADIPRLHPGVDQVITVAVRRWRKHVFSAQTWRDLGQLRQRLHAHHYDNIIDTQGLLKSALIGSLAQGSYHGQDKHSAREPLAARFYQHRHAVARGQHAVTRNRELAARALGYAVPANPPDYGIRAGTPDPALGLPLHYVTGLHATSRDAKLWPESHWIALGLALHQQGRSLVLPWGNPSEQARAQRIASAIPGCLVLPRLGLQALAAVIAQGEAAIGVDTGLVHLAAALQRPTVAIYTDTQPALTGVQAQNPHMVRNLGGEQQIPAVDEVLLALAAVTTPA